VHNVTVIRQAIRDHDRGDRREHFAYRDSPRALTVVPAQALREGRPISRDQIHRADRRELDRAPASRQAPAANWIAPPVRAVRSPDGERNGFVGREGRRDERQRQDAASPRSRDPGRDDMRREPPPVRETAPRSSGGRDVPERRRGDEPRPPTPDETLPSRRTQAPAEVERRTQPDERRPQPDARRDIFGRTPEVPPEAAPVRQPAAPVPRPDARGERDVPARGLPDERAGRREMPPAGQREFQPGTPRENRRDNPTELQRDMPREVPREMPRPERNIQREAPTGQPFEAPRRSESVRPTPEFRALVPQPQREMPAQRVEPPRQSAPEMRAPQPQREMHQQRAEPPRQQGGGQGEPRRRQDDDRGR
jgi:hypothetical protein